MEHNHEHGQDKKPDLDDLEKEQEVPKEKKDEKNLEEEKKVQEEKPASEQKWEALRQTSSLNLIFLVISIFTGIIK